MNRSALGAVVRLKAGDRWQTRDISSQSGRGSQNSLTLHFGLGQAAIIDSLEIRWTGSGIVDRYSGLDAGTTYNFSVSRLESGSGSQPGEFVLFANYPNPFNPETVIRYRTGVTGQVELSVYNVQGQKVATLVSGMKPAGEYEVTWNAGGKASGVYYYTLTTSMGTISRKMVYIK
jgi:hypothetical protein